MKRTRSAPSRSFGGVFRGARLAGSSCHGTRLRADFNGEADVFGGSKYPGVGACPLPPVYVVFCAQCFERRELAARLVVKVRLLQWLHSLDSTLHMLDADCKDLTPEIPWASSCDQCRRNRLRGTRRPPCVGGVTHSPLAAKCTKMRLIPCSQAAAISLLCYCLYLDSRHCHTNKYLLNN